MAGDDDKGAPSPDDDVSSDVALVRMVLARELDTINEYEALARRAKNETLKAFFRHLALEEKEHVAEAMALIRAFDPDQEQKSSSADVRPEHFGGAPAPAPREAPDQARPARRLERGLTVGSLKGIRNE